MINLANGQAEALAIATIMGTIFASGFVLMFGADLIESFIDNVSFGNHSDDKDSDEPEE
jgi:hypothetical protein